jgi:hypothetical protein
MNLPDEMAVLRPLLGTWDMRVALGGDDDAARTVFEWTLDGRFLLQRFEVEHPQAPDGLCLIAADEVPGGFLQHYFDERGVVRLYAMTFGDGVWTLRRETADFSPLPFAQRFEGRLSPDGTRIDARWEVAHQPDAWELDFELTYARVT